MEPIFLLTINSEDRYITRRWWIKSRNADLRYNVDKRVLQERWQKPGDVAKYKRLTNSVNGSETRPTSRFVMDENTLTFGSLSLTYGWISKIHVFLKKSFISSLKWGFTMEDIFISHL